MIDDALGIPAAWTSGTVDSNGVDLQYVRTNTDGPPLVIAHGVFDDALCREPLIDELADDYDVIAYDARGHGRSSAPQSGYAMPDRVDDLVGLLDALGIETATLLGHSMGGDTVAATASDHPDRVRALVMVDPAGMLDSGGDDPERDHDEIVAEVREQIAEWHDHTIGELLEDDPELRAHVEADQKRLAKRIAAANLRVDPSIAAVFKDGWLDPRETYPEITAPTLILKADAEEDERECHRTVASLLPDGQLVHVDGAGHTVFRDEREQATGALRSFLDSV